jgi:hypothetical protein
MVISLDLNSRDLRDNQDRVVTQTPRMRHPEVEELGWVWFSERQRKEDRCHEKGTAKRRLYTRYDRSKRAQHAFAGSATGTDGAKSALEHGFCE